MERSETTEKVPPSEYIVTLPKKVAAIKNIATTTNKRQLRRFVGMVDYYRDMWIRRSEALAPLTTLTSKEAKWEWTNVHQTSFDNMKKLIARAVLYSAIPTSMMSLKYIPTQVLRN